MRKVANATGTTLALVGGAAVIASFLGAAPVASAVGVMTFGFACVIVGCVTLLVMVATG